MSLHSTAARFLIVVASVYTACLQLFSTSSLAYRAAGDGWLIDAVNGLVLAASAVAGADLLWHDVLRRGLIWPSFPAKRRHSVCVAVYLFLAAAFAVRAFIASGNSAIVFQVGTYYVLIAVGICAEALALALEEREECQSTSDSA